MEDALSKARTLSEALPYIQKFAGKVIVIKIGGAAMDSREALEAIARDIVVLKYVGMRPVLVHGGGPQIGEHLKKIGKVSKFINGQRVTDKETLDVVQMVLIGKVNKDLVTLITLQGGQAVGLSGHDGGLIKAQKYSGSDMSTHGVEGTVDYGLVGEINSIDTTIINTLDPLFIPVIAPLGVGKDGTSYNINADIVAGRLAGALHAERLLLMTDVDGVKGSDGTLLESLTADDIRTKIKDKSLTGGMIPKVECCLEALNHGVQKAHIINGCQEHALLLELFTPSGVGTEIILNR